MAEALDFPGRSFSVEEWRRRWQAAGFGEEPGATHDRVFWCPTRAWTVVVHHTPYGRGAGGHARTVEITRVEFQDHASGQRVVWSEGEFDALDIGWAGPELRAAMERLFAASEAASIAKGERVRVVRGKARGSEGEVFWLGPSKYGPGLRVGLRTDAGEKIWAAGDELEALGGAGSSDWTELHEACDAGHLERVRELLAAGVELDAATAAPRASRAVRGLEYPAGSTALHLALRQPNVELARELLAAGCDPELADARGRSAGELIGERWGAAPSKRIAALIPDLLEAGAELDRGVVAAVEWGNGYALLALAEAGFDFDRPLLDGPSLRARLSGPAELQWKKARRVLNAASAKHGEDPSSKPSPSKQ